MKRLMMAEMWDSYAREVLPKNTPTVQRRECRRAFYSGVMSVLIVRSSGEEVTEADFQGMSDLQSELEKFCQDVKDGRA